ncbi:MAG: benzoate-CoA ligase family protein, partial [Myxococcales bacterium]|nr:benzoate-CoA ligase family protein [Myxococcales bacterium]
MTALVDPPQPYNAVAHFIERHLQEGRGEKIAYVDQGGATSYAELARRVYRAAGALAAAGVDAEQRVVL